MSTVSVPGVSLYYEVRGTGPVLLIIPGGPQDAGVFADLAGHLADRYTVVTYDPRGNSRSSIEGEPEDQSVDVHADDAAALIDAVAGGPAYVFGTSGGGQIGLNLTARHRERVRALVTHEPACTMMLDDPAPVMAEDQAIYATYRREGVEVAMQAFFGENGLDDETDFGDGPPFEMSREDMETFERVSGNFEYFLAHGLIPLSSYVPDVEALKAGEAPVVVGLGEESEGQIIHDIGRALAAKLRVEPVAFPGDHIGFGPHAEEFAKVLDGSLKS